MLKFVDNCFIHYCLFCILYFVFFFFIALRMFFSHRYDNYRIFKYKLQKERYSIISTILMTQKASLIENSSYFNWNLELVKYRQRYWRKISQIQWSHSNFETNDSSRYIPCVTLALSFMTEVFVLPKLWMVRSIPSWMLSHCKKKQVGNQYPLSQIIMTHHSISKSNSFNITLTIIAFYTVHSTGFQLNHISAS